METKVAEMNVQLIFRALKALLSKHEFHNLSENWAPSFAVFQEHF
jgi:hypothetical protein